MTQLKLTIYNTQQDPKFDIGKFKNDLGWSYYCWLFRIVGISKSENGCIFVMSDLV
jgi:hypothetical protein